MIILKKTSHYLLIFAYLCLGLCCTITLPACDSDDNNDNSARNSSVKAQRVEVVEVVKKPVSLTQTVSGTLEAVTRIRLYNEEGGRVTSLPFHEGDFVKKGVLLVQLDNELLKTDVAKARASREQAELDLSRLKHLLSKKISTEEEVARARTELDLASAEETRQNIRLQRTSIIAPIDGVLSERLYEPGDMLAEQSHILTMIDPSALRLKASLAERWLPLVEKDQAVTLRIDALGDKKYSARVVRIYPTVNVSTHKGIVEILIDPVPDNATAGQFASADIELKATERVIVPVHTVHYEAKGSYLYRVIENAKNQTVVEKVFFEQGQQYASSAEILSGLNPGDLVVSRGFLALNDGKAVEIASSTKNLSKPIQNQATQPDTSKK